MMWRQVIEVAKREVITRGRTRGFRAITGLMVLMAIAAPIIFSLLPEDSDDLPEVTIAIADDVDPVLGDRLVAFADGQLDVNIESIDGDIEALDALLDSGDVDVAIEGPNRLAWPGEPDPSLTSLIVAAIQQGEVLERADGIGLDPSELAALFAPVDIENRSVDEDDSSDDVRSAVAFIGLFTAFLLPQVFGQLTMLSVVEEKSTRVVEVLLSHLRPRTLLLGKILGLCFLAVVQLLLIIIALAGALAFTNAIDVPSSVWRFVPMLAVSVLGGLAIYTTLFALLGSLISRQEDAAQVMMPVFVPLMAGYFAGQTAVFGTADSLLLKILTWFPLTSPMILPVRVARDAIGPIETAISLGLLALGVWLLLRLAGRLYEFTLLRTGSRVGWKEVLRLSRGAVT